jgi:hypothetical protein
MVSSTNGETFSKAVHDNLGHLLVNLAEKAKDGDTKYYWNDCMCLDQENHAETSEQVARMGTIYSTAAEVMIWLGHDPKIIKALKIIQGTDDSYEEMDAEDTTTKYEERERFNTSWDQWHIENAYIYLLSLDYWNRVWILQEVVLAKTVWVHAGHTSITFNAFAAGAPSFNHVDIGPSKPRYHAFSMSTTSLDDMANFWQYYKLRTLASLINVHCERESTKKADKIYGLLGLVADDDDGSTLAERMEVNTEKETFEVFWDTALECHTFRKEYFDLANTLSYMLDPDNQAATPFWSVAAVQAYHEHPRTSSVHKTYATHLLRSCRGTIDLIHLLWLSNHSLKRLSYLLYYGIIRKYPISKSQSAALMGMEIFHQDIEQESTDEKFEESLAKAVTAPILSEYTQGYNCATHHALGPRGQELTSKGFYTSYTLIMIPFPIPRLRCSRDCSPMCDDSVIAFTMEEIQFQVLVFRLPEGSSERVFRSVGEEWTEVRSEGEPVYCMRLSMG